MCCRVRPLYEGPDEWPDETLGEQHNEKDGQWADGELRVNKENNL